ncbi:hypothetical protein M9980_06910 [Sphingomonas donggukensis]|uniref:Phasin domain-containing protein n=1 Tax=Sphingomonas donggukensis TaxID=2949093 RepID=A0ABY4TWZ8_9SPHN|nr:hypothetical protein [Sphingomonas donggukensis]URW76916.1 hypothetical protein M9980_06910 [Sphingomonas donggukensis]
MSDFFSTAIAFQQEILRAQQAQMDAAQKALDMGRQMMAAQAQSQKAAKANLQAWNRWASLWGWK